MSRADTGHSYLPVIGAVLCGGRSSRFGSDKALAPAGETTVGGLVVEALRAGGADPVVAIGGTAGPTLNIPTVPDLRPGDGPLPALASALLWAKTGSVVVVPCDLVLLTADHVSSLVTTARDKPDKAAIATVGGQPRISLGVWPAAAGRDVLRLVDDGRRMFKAALDVVDWVPVEVSEDAVTDADTPEDLARLLAGRAD